LAHNFRRYNIVAETTESAKGQAMSPRIIEDLERRNITETFDFIPIAANVCNYDIRLHSNHLAKSLYSVGLCVLTMYLLNGEIIFNDGRISALPIATGLSKYLEYISFDNFIPPSRKEKLSWLRHCRLRPVKLSAAGVDTTGHIWHLDKEIRTSDWLRPPRFLNGWKMYGLKEYERNTLSQLSEELRDLGICDSLLGKLDQYLKQDERLQDHPAWPESYMNTMAEEIVDAIGDGRRLYFATLKDSFEAFAIFVMGEEAEALPVAEEDFFVFTSSSESHHVSMTVDLEYADSDSKLPLLTVTGWTNGLAFDYGVPCEKAAFRWPKVWQRDD
jgi:hypothetical protein